jgi:predicted Zn-ribbon and HTH transcriptional regulator
MEMRVSEVLDDLEHVRKSLRRRFVFRPAFCSRCSFVFERRTKLGTPSRCPKCKNERLDGPWFRVEDKP